MQLDEYCQKYPFADISRDTDGVLTVQLHTADGPLIWDDDVHRSLPTLLHAIATDRQTRVVVLVGTGDEFIHYPEDNTRQLTSGQVRTRGFDRTFADARRIIENLIDIEVPVLAAVNGPAHAHCEIALLSDIVISADNASFADEPHFPSGIVPGDGIQTVLSELLGPNRARFHMLTGKQISPQQALEWGLVAELLPGPEVLPRTLELAAGLACQNPFVLRYTRQVFMHPFKLALAQTLTHGLALETIGSMSYSDWK